MFKKLTLIIFIALIVSGCKVTPAKQVFTTPPTNKEINVYSLIPQDELEALYPISDNSAVTMQFGLVGALVGAVIDTSINKSNAEVAEENLADIRNELIGLEFDKLFEQEIHKKLNGQVNIGKIQTVKSMSELKSKLVAGETYLLLDTYYKMDIDFRTPFIVTSVSLHEKSKTKRKDTQLYKNTFTYFGLSLPVPLKTQEFIDAKVEEINNNFAQLSEKSKKSRKARLKRQKNLKKARKTTMSFDDANAISADAWSTEYKEELDEGIRGGIQQLFTLIANDMADKTEPESYAKNGMTLEGYPAYHKVILVDETENRKIIRFSQGHRAGAICSMPKEESADKLVCL
ncbi:MAG: hypothetical protein JKY10_09240 [Cohaesibacteraceae bacterium]|nr:hypothetical protein [Cohaesibacteraceae bacterium]